MVEGVDFLSIVIALAAVSISAITGLASLKSTKKSNGAIYTIEDQLRQEIQRVQRECDRDRDELRAEVRSLLSENLALRRRLDA